MLFSSITFLFYFLPLFLLAYHALPWRNLILLTGSLIFYAWGDPRALPLLIVCILWNWALAPATAQRGTRGTWAVAIGVAGNLALLAWYKYAGFVLAQLTIVGIEIPQIETPTLPLGISFFTFQGISYLIDVHRGVVPPQRNLLTFAAYKSMFPQLVAGPIVRYAQVAEQMENRSVDAARLNAGVETFLIGLGQKVLLANTLAAPVDQLHALPPGSIGAAAAWLGAAAYGLQIYFDFCGYTNMAIGLGRMMGFELPPNFDRPYAAQSVTGFWRRWHISLSTWFRDYLYIPLGGNRAGAARTWANLLIVFVLCGFWHGASWTFVVWGLWHGLFLVLERAGLGRVLARAPRPLRHLYLLTAVTLGWVFFRADTLGAALAWLRAMAGFGGTGGLDPFASASVCAALVAGAICAVWPREWRPGVTSPELTRLAGGAACLGLLLLSALSLASGTYNPFIYFRF